MYHCISISSIPRIEEIYIISRKTVWTCADKRNILVYVEEGSVIFIIENNKFVLKKGQVLLIPAGQPYIRMPHENNECKFVYIHFITQKPIYSVTHQEIKNYFKTLSENKKQIIAPSDKTLSTPEETVFMSQTTNINECNGQTIFDFLSNLYKEFKKTDHYQSLLVNIRFTEFLISIGRETISDILSNRVVTNVQFPNQLQKAIFYIHENYTKKITTEELCAIGNISPQHLVRLFRKFLNVTPVQYINQTKVAYAIEMLRSTNFSVNEIAFELGFEDPNYFRRLFKKEKNISPSDYRDYITSH